MTVVNPITLGTKHGDKAGIISSNGIQGSGQSVLLSGSVLAGGSTVAAQIEIRFDHGSLPLKFDSSKRYSVEITEI